MAEEGIDLRAGPWGRSRTMSSSVSSFTKGTEQGLRAQRHQGAEGWGAAADGEMLGDTAPSVCQNEMQEQLLGVPSCWGRGKGWKAGE